MGSTKSNPRKGNNVQGKTDNASAQGNAIRSIRANKGLTQQQLADFVGVRRETIANLERGKYSPSLELADRIACSLQCHLYDVFPSLGSKSYYLEELSYKKEQTRTATLEGVLRYADAMK